MSWSNYEKVKKIGEGAFGLAWLVKSKKDNKNYVIKQINVAKMPLREREEAKKEVSVLAQMKHPNIVSYVDSFEEGGNLCIVMDYCDGGDLYSKIQSARGVLINEDQILDWFVQLTLALKHVHDRKILHRDLKSQNIFLTKDGTIKLGDFGVAKVLNTTTEFAKTAIGTPYYMSPEICEHKPYNNKSDVWSLGCILYEMTNMKHPFEANSLQMLIGKILRGNYDQVNPRYSYELRNLVASMLKRNPRERPSVNGILRLPFIKRLREKFLTEEEISEEFSHTVLHGENFKKKILNQNLINKPSAIKLAPKQSSFNVPTPVFNGALNPTPRYDPSKIYGAPVVPRPSSSVQKSQDKKVVDIQKRAPSSDRQSANIRGSYLDLKAKKKEFEDALLKKQKELAEKQKLERYKREREKGWQNILPIDDKEENDENLNNNNNNSPYPYVNVNRGAEPVVDRYEKYQHQLELQAIRRREIEEELVNFAKKLKNSPNEKPKPAVRKSSNYGIQKPIIKNPILNEFKKNKEEYEKNRANGNRPFNNPLAPRPPQIKKNPDQLLYDRLKQIRKQNLNRKPIVPIKPPRITPRSSIDKQDPENRLKRIAALKQQKDEMLVKANKDLEKRRNDAFDKEKQFIEKEAKKIIDFKPATQIEMTKVLGAIGVIGKQISKAEILKDLNENYSPRENRKSWQKATDLKSLENKTLIQQTIAPSSNEIISPRKEWGSPQITVLNALEKAKIQTSKTLVPDDVTILENSSTITSPISKSRTIIFEDDRVDSKNRQNKELNLTTCSSASHLSNEKPPELFNNMTNSSFNGTWDDVIKKISPDKMETLKQTKNLLLEMTLGHLDVKNKKLLRTCSVPDLLEKSLKEEIDDDDEVIIANKENKFRETGKVGTIRLARSLDDLNKNEKSSDSGSELENSDKNLTVSNGDNSSDNDIDDISEIIESYKSLIIENDKELDHKNNTIIKKNDRNSRKKNDIELDSLEISYRLNDENDCETVSLNGDESDGSDTEFEEEKPKFDEKCSIEERRANLEKNLGKEKFLKNFRQLKNAILDEEDFKLDSGKTPKSFKLFCELFPGVDKFWFEELCELVNSDM
ncbi:unnamed protein product [Brachionus calyciflorus]|uniref:non-specific serine/threonine protein kinase n=1 Tax=Brachionus calyciflorus TaxID=104777 RepID=A0A814CJG5_9BILA|nr:unnamed protein product [Brachionus calyciflorus]